MAVQHGSWQLISSRDLKARLLQNSELRMHVCETATDLHCQQPLPTARCHHTCAVFARSQPL